MKKIAVYTVITGMYDMPKPVNPSFCEDADFFLFTDNIETSYNYKIINVDACYGENAKIVSRRYKMLPHRYLPGYDYHIYLDGSIVLLSSPSSLIDKYMRQESIVTFKHFERQCIYEEAAVCYAVKLADPGAIFAQVRFLQDQGYPINNGLSETGVIIRKNTDQISSLNELWWSIFQLYPTRDQLSFNFCLWKKYMNCGYLDGTAYNTNEFKLYPHL